jgi:hypothetical protein
LYSGVRLTEAEIKRNQLDRELLKMAKQRISLKDKVCHDMAAFRSNVV